MGLFVHKELPVVLAVPKVMIPQYQEYSDQAVMKLGAYLIQSNSAQLLHWVSALSNSRSCM